MEGYGFIWFGKGIERVLFRNAPKYCVRFGGTGGGE